MKKLLMLSTAFTLMASASAYAQVSVTFGEPAYYAPAPVYQPGYVVAPDWPSNHYDYHRHRHNDYWAHHRNEERDHAERDDHRDHRR